MIQQQGEQGRLAGGGTTGVWVGPGRGRGVGVGERGGGWKCGGGGKSRHV